jgi:hypothetical protein
MPDEPKKVFDVAKPGDSKPDASARPIIVGHGPMVQDPMMAAESKDKSEPPTAPDLDAKAKADEEKSPEKAVFHGPKRIEPLHTESEEDSPAKILEEETVPAETTEEKSEPAKETESETKTEDEKSTDEQTDTGSSDSAAVDALAASAEKRKIQETEAEMTKRKAMQELANSKKYYVPIKETHGKKSTGAFTVILLLLVVAAGFYLAVDAELIDIGMKVPFELIK